MSATFKPGDRVWAYLGTAEAWRYGEVVTAWDVPENYTVMWHANGRVITGQRPRAMVLSDNEYAAHLLVQ